MYSEHKENGMQICTHFSVKENKQPDLDSQPVGKMTNSSTDHTNTHIFKWANKLI